MSLKLSSSPSHSGPGLGEKISLASRGLALFVLASCGDASVSQNTGHESTGEQGSTTSGNLDTGLINDSTGIIPEDDSDTKNTDKTTSSGETTDPQITTGTDVNTSTTTLDDSSTGGSLETTTTDFTTGVMAICGDGIVEGGEVCDDGINDGTYNGCQADCKAEGPHCGDAEPQKPEQCDDGLNDGSYGSCSVDCEEFGPHCGDGVIQAEEEICDMGSKNNPDYQCNDNCELAPEYCGDNLIQANYGEKCEGTQGISDLKCDSKVCSYSFKDLQQIHCSGDASVSPDGIAGCGQGDADIVCQLRHNNPDSKAENFSLNNAPLLLPLIGQKINDGININLGAMPKAGLINNVFYVPQEEAQGHAFKYSPQINGWITKVYCFGE